MYLEFISNLSRWISSDVGRQTNGGSSLSGGEDWSMSGFLDVFEELRLGRSRISATEDVDVTANAMLASRVLRLASEHTEERPFSEATFLMIFSLKWHP